MSCVDAPIRGNVRSDDQERSIHNALALSRLAALGALAADQFLYPVVNLVAYCPYRFERLSFGVGERPVDDPQIWNERAVLSAPHRHKDRGGLGKFLREELRSCGTQIDSDFSHHLHHFGMDVVGRLASSRDR